MTLIRSRKREGTVMGGDQWKKAVTDAWDEMADTYDAYVGTQADYYRTQVIGPGLLAACGKVRGQRVLDLGCGQGYFARLLAGAGATVIGVDISERQIAHARRREAEHPLGIEYFALDAAKIDQEWPPSTFDRITSCIAFQDMPNPFRVMESVKILLKPRGRVVLLVEHQMNGTPLREWERDESGRKIALRVDRYFNTGPRETTWTLNSGDTSRTFRFPSWNRTLEEWSTVFAQAGFLIAQLTEPRPTEKQVEQIPDLDDCSRIPYFLIFDLVPRGSG